MWMTSTCVYFSRLRCKSPMISKVPRKLSSNRIAAPAARGASVCRFDVLTMVDGHANVHPIACGGCGVCDHVCPEDAIVMEDVTSGDRYMSKTTYRPMVHAKLGTNTSSSMDPRGRPSRGFRQCLGALIVTEPTASGIRDLERVLALADHFGVKTAVVQSCSSG